MNSSSAQTESQLGYEFGGFVLDPLRRQLRRVASGEPVLLTPRVFDALQFFLDRPGELIGRETLMQALWPGLVVEENNLSQTLLALRRALGDEQRDRYVMTIPRRGFRFVCAVHRVAMDDATRGARPADAARDEADAEADGEADGEAAGEAAAPAPPTTPRREGDLPRRDERVSAARAATHATPAAIAGIAAIVMLIAALAFMALRGSRGAQPAAHPTAAAPAITLAVLPFKPLVAEHRDEILELGMADSLIVRISPMPGLVVRSIGSARRIADIEPDALAAARQLDVQWILQGTIQRWGNRLRVSARLLNAADGTASWSGSFDERFDDVFRMQDQIAERVAERLLPSLAAAAATAAGRSASSSSGSARVALSQGTRDVDAYQLYLTARFHAQSIRPSGLASSIELFERAIARDPGFALAYAALAESLRRLTVGADALPGTTLPRARAAAERAIELDAGAAEGHSALGWALWWHEWNWSAAEASFRRALALNPNLAEAHLGLGHLLLSQRRDPTQGLQAMRRARELDPLSLITNTLEASYLVALGRRDEGVSRLAKALEIDAQFWPAQLLLATVHLAAGEIDQAIATARRAEQLSEGSAQATSRLVTVLARAGRNDEARSVLARLESRSDKAGADAPTKRYVPPTMLAEAHCALGDRSRTLDALERAYALRDIHLAFVKITPCLVALQGLPRFDALVRKMGLPEGAGSGGKL